MKFVLLHLSISLLFRLEKLKKVIILHEQKEKKSAV
jgi:hypothetical protein